jgi:hypothetical protein
MRPGAADITDNIRADSALTARRDLPGEGDA